MAGSFKINRREIAKMTREIQREFDKHPIAIPVTAEGPDVPRAGGETHIYAGDGPVIQIRGDNAQVAWNNDSVQQGGQSQQIAPGFELIAQAVASTLDGLRGLGLSAADEDGARVVAAEVLEEVTSATPDASKIRRALSALKGFLAPVAMGLSAGAIEGAEDWARTAVEQLGQSWPG